MIVQIACGDLLLNAPKAQIMTAPAVKSREQREQIMPMKSANHARKARFYRFCAIITRNNSDCQLF